MTRIRNLSIAILAGFASFAASSFANAADMPITRPIVKAPYSAPVSDWAGLYVGAAGGYSKMSDVFATYSTDPTIKMKGPDLTFYVGAQKQFGNFVVGVEADWSKSWQKGSSYEAWEDWCNKFSTAKDIRQDWFATARVRAGMLVTTNTLVYVTGGIMAAHTTRSAVYTTVPKYDGLTTTSGRWEKVGAIGPVWGGGIEHKLTQNWSVRLQGLAFKTNSYRDGWYDSYGNKGGSKLDQTGFVAQAGIGYQF